MGIKIDAPEDRTGEMICMYSGTNQDVIIMDGYPRA